VFNLGYFKGQPTDYVIRYAGGAAVQDGPALTFFYLRYRTQIVVVPTASADAAFVFNELTSNFQAVTLQGQFTYRVADPKKLASRLNFAIDPATRRYLTTDPDRVPSRISNAIQIEARTEVQARSLEDTLKDAQAIADRVLTRLRAAPLLGELGVEVTSVYFLSAKPTPEVGQALEAEYRESLLRKADEAIYARRAAAVEEERKVKEKELASDRALEEQRAALIVLQGANAKQEAENRAAAAAIDAAARAEGIEKELAAYREADPRVVLAAGLRALGDNADKVGNLTFTTELLAGLLNGPRQGG
jgi:regulator of protease activity HflC (stomatin/prohibitin superfamily)